MSFHANSARLTVLSLAIASLFPCLSHAETTALDEVVVTATRTETRADAVVSEVVVIDRETIDRSAGRTLTEVLTRAAGVQMGSNGGRGKNSSVFIRGTESRHSILLIDGVRYGSATTGAPSLDNIPLDMIDHIEVLKGPASALYGSEAVGGVIQIFMRKGSAGFHPSAAVTVGSDHYWQANASLAGGQGDVTYSLGVQKLRDGSFSSTNPKVQFGNFNPDSDAFKQDAVNASAEWRINPDWKLGGNLLYANGLVHLDDGPGIDSRTDVRSLAANLTLSGKFTSIWKSKLTYGQGDDTSNAVAGSFLPSDFKTQQRQIIWQNDIDTPVGVVLLGAEYLRQQVSGSTNYAVKERDITSVFAGVNGNAGIHSWQLNVRGDDNSQYGTKTTGFAGYGLQFLPQWRARAGYGTSFVAPSFNQLYFPNFGNPNLEPEKGKNTEFGLDWTSGAHQVRLTRFDNRIRGFIANTTIASNIPRAKIDGWTLAYTGKIGAFGLRASADFLDPRNDVNGKLLPRRAKRQFTAGADYAVGSWTFGGSALYVDDRFDNAANTLRLGSYATFDLYATYALCKDWSVQAKLNNLTDKHYETAYGYNQQGRAVFVTLRYAAR